MTVFRVAFGENTGAKTVCFCLVKVTTGAKATFPVIVPIPQMYTPADFLNIPNPFSDFEGGRTFSVGKKKVLALSDGLRIFLIEMRPQPVAKQKLIKAYVTKLHNLERLPAMFCQGRTLADFNDTGLF